MLTSAEARKRLGVSRSKLQALIHDGEIEAIKIGPGRTSHLRISEEAIDAYLKRSKVQPAKAAS